MSSFNDYFKNGGSYADDIEELRKEMAQLSAVFTGQYVFMPPRAGSANVALVEPNGALLNRTAYPKLWAWALTQTGLLVDDATWQTIKAASPIKSCALYSTGDGSTTFRVPDTGNGGFSRFLGTGSLPGNIDEGFNDQLQNITGTFGFLTSSSQHLAPYIINGVFAKSAPRTNSSYHGNGGSPNTNLDSEVSFDASRVARTGDETHPQGDYKRLYIYTGNQTSFLPTPTPDWLNQQTTNTAAIAELNKPKQFMFARGGDVTNFSGGQKFYFHDTLGQGITYDNLTRDFTVSEAGVYEVIHTVFATAVGGTPKRAMLSKNRTAVPATSDTSTYFAQIYINPIDAEYGPAALHGFVRCDAGDTIQSWNAQGQFYLGSTNNTDWFNQITIKKVD